MGGSERLRWLIVGTGDIVRKRVAEAVATADGGRLVGVCGGRDRAESIACEHGDVGVYDDLSTALAEADADAVYVATPVDRHADEAIAALQAGKHVLVEKPLGVNADEAQRIAEAAASTGLTAGCAYYRRCSERYRHLRRLIDAGDLGPIVLVRTAYHGWFDPAPDDPKHWRIDPDRSGGGPLSDMGSHMIDLIVGLFGEPKSVSARTDTLAHPGWKVEDSSAAVMTLPNGAHALATFGWNSKTWTHEFEVVGRDARVRWSPADAGPVQITRGRDTEPLDLPPAGNVHRPLIEDFNEAVRDGRSPACPVADAVATNRVLDAIYRSAAATPAGAAAHP
jgi:predicted dehydrogenase